MDNTWSLENEKKSLLEKWETEENVKFTKFGSLLKTKPIIQIHHVGFDLRVSCVYVYNKSCFCSRSGSSLDKESLCHSSILPSQNQCFY